MVELLSTIGTATPNYPLKAETLEADLWFQSNPEFESARSQLGLLDRLLPKDALIEVFQNPATPFEIGGCKNKRFSLEAEFVRKAKREKIILTASDLPSLLILMPTASEDIRDGFGAIETLTPGVYNLPKWDRTTIVVLHQLPKTEETLWLRLLGRAGNQRRAIEEFTQMSIEVPLNANIGELLADYRAMLESRKSPITEDEEELIMNLSTAYLQKREEWKEEGKKEGKKEGVYQVASNLLRQGMAIELVAQATELTLEQIAKLRQELG